MEKITIIIPVYNVEKYLERCLDSVVNQTYKDFRVILVNDGSTDSSGIICDRYAQKYSYFTVIHQENRGISAARNAGLLNATGEYISFIDSDDCVCPDFLETLYNNAVIKSADISMCGLTRFSQQPDYGALDAANSDKEPYIVDRKTALINMADRYKWEWVIVWNKLYRRELFDNIRFEEGKIHEDEFIMHQLIYKVQYVAVTDKILYLYYYNDNGITVGTYKKLDLDIIEAISSRAEFYESNNEEELYSITILELLEKIQERYTQAVAFGIENDIVLGLDKQYRDAFYANKERCGITILRYPKLYIHFYPKAEFGLKVLNKIIKIFRGVKK